MDTLMDGDNPVNEGLDFSLRALIDIIWLLRWLVGVASEVRRRWDDRRRKGQHQQLIPEAS